MARFTENEIKVIKQFNLNSDVKIVFTIQFAVRGGALSEK